MKKSAIKIMAITIIITIGLLVFGSIVIGNGGYEYVDMNGNKGNADYCYTKGIMYCQNGKKTIQVQEYYRK